MIPKTKYAIGVLNADGFHLTSLPNVLQMRPDMSSCKVGGVRRIDDGKAPADPSVPCVDWVTCPFDLQLSLSGCLLINRSQARRGESVAEGEERKRHKYTRVHSPYHSIIHGFFVTIILERSP